MKRFLVPLVPVALAFATGASAQTQVTGTVLDAYTSARIGNVTVVDSNSSATVQTDNAGEFSLPCTGATTLVFRKIGYQATQRTITSCTEDVQVGLIPGAQSLAAVNVVGSAEAPTIEQAQSITMLSPRALNRSSGLFLQQALNLTPGIRMQRRTMGGGQTITIRGYRNDGDGGNFIGTGYKAYINGIPITDAEGETVLDDIDMASLGRVEVVRGPASTIYGGGIGGVVNLYTAVPHRLGFSVVEKATGGSHGLFRTDTRLQHVSDDATATLSYGHQGYDSYRIHSASRKDHGTFLGNFRPSSRERISTFATYGNSHDLRAGELDSASFFQELNTGEDRYIANNAHQDVEMFRAGVTHSYQMSDHVQNVATASFSGGTLEDVYAAGLNSKSIQNFGARVVFNTDFAAGTLPLHGVTGGEFQKTNRFAQGYGLKDAVLGAMRSDVETHTMQYNVFTQWSASLPADFTLTAGASLNFLEYSINDRMASSANPDHLDGSGRKTFDPVVTPRVALRKMFTPNISAYANVSQGYSPPSSDDAIISFTGEPNTGLEPERATQYEIGSKGNLLGNRLSYQVALFDLKVKNKLSSQAVFDVDGTVLYSYTVNAGDQSDKGLELGASYALVDNPANVLSSVRPFVTYTYSDFTYDSFKSDANNDANTVDYTGKHVAGVSKNIFNIGIDAALRSGLYMNATYQHTDDLPVTFDNAHWAPGYSLLNAKIGFARAVGNQFNLNAFVGGNNLSGSRYYTQVFLNHKWDTQVAPHLYLPGPYDATYYGGVSVTYSP